MKEYYTPSEHLEAADKARQHEKGREQANFYRTFLDTLRQRVVRQLIRKGINQKLGVVDIDTTNLPLSKFEFCDVQSITEYIKEAGEKASQITGISESMNADPHALVNMTPSEFYVYIDDLKANLIKK